MRLFIAINFSEENLNILRDTADLLRRNSTSGNFTRTENFHITLAFLGEISGARVSGIRHIINEAVMDMTPFEFSIGGLGRFRRTGGDIYWLGVEKTPELMELADRLNKKLRAANYSVEDRAFKPHLTLGREVILCCKPEILATPRLSCKVNRISLMKSERIRGVLTYTEIYGKELS